MVPYSIEFFVYEKLEAQKCTGGTLQTDCIHVSHFTALFLVIEKNNDVYIKKCAIPIALQFSTLLSCVPARQKNFLPAQFSCYQLCTVLHSHSLLSG